MQTLLSVLRTVERRVEAVVPIFLEKCAEFVVSDSPVDTGAFVTSWTITTSSGAGRSRTANNKLGGQDISAKHAEALTQLRSDIASIPPTMPNIYITNRAPHARYVKSRSGLGESFSSGGNQTITLLKANASTYLEDAVEEARQIQ